MPASPGVISRILNQGFAELVMSKPQEFELKLECEPSRVDDIRRHLAGARSDDPHSETITSVYFDTDDKKLGDAGVFLRVRRLCAAIFRRSRPYSPDSSFPAGSGNGDRRAEAGSWR